MELDKEHINLLKRAYKGEVYLIMNDNTDKEVEYLRSKKLITYSYVTMKGDVYYEISIDEQGKAEIHTLRRKSLQVWIPVVISNLIALTSLIISIIALLK